MHLPARFSKPKTHEELFVEHYDWLVRWSLQFSNQLREDANDLVHDLYLQLVQTRPEIDTTNEDRARGYLYTMLHNLAISKARRSGHDPLATLSIVDYDSVEYGLASVDRSQLIFVRSDLARICEYARQRKQTSRAASVLILRFFLSYLPSEIVTLFGTTRVAVESHLRDARLEVRAYLRNPRSIRFLGFDVTPSSSERSLPENPEFLFLELRRRLFENNPGECLTEERIGTLGEGTAEPLSTVELAHVVGCPVCLERINRHLDLPSLRHRQPGDSTGRDTYPRQPNPRGDADFSLTRKLRNTYEHQPCKLQIAVDGEIRASQRISMSHNELQIKLNPLRRPSFLEVFSEQGLRLLYLQMDERPKDLTHPSRVTATLSGGRSVELEFSLMRGAAIASAAYHDPCFVELFGEEARPSQDSPAAFRSPRVASSPLTHPIQSFVRRNRSILGRRKVLTPALATVAIGISLILCRQLLVTKASHPLPIRTAAALLANAATRLSAPIEAGGAIHSTYTLEATSDRGRVLSRQKIDVWRSVRPQREALRLIDRGNVLVAGQWKVGDQTIASYAKRHLSTRHLSPGSDQSLQPQEVWELVPEDAMLHFWGGLGTQARVVREPEGIEIQYQRPAATKAPAIVQATLVLDPQTMRPIRQDLVVEAGSARREYRFETLTYHVVAAEQVHDSDFAPPVVPASLRSGLRLDDLGTGAGAELMLSALEVMQRLGSTISDAVELERLPNGKIQVSGVLPTSEQRTAVSNAFLSLRAGDRLEIALHSADEPPPASSVSTPVQIESTAPLPVAEAYLPFEAELRSAFAAQKIPPAEFEARIRELAQVAVLDGANLHRSAWLFQGLAARDFSPQELAALHHADQREWISLLSQQTHAFVQQFALLKRDLEFLPEQPHPTSTPVPPLNNVSELAQAAIAQNRDCGLLERYLTSGLTLAPPGSAPPPSPLALRTLFHQIEVREQMLSATVDRLSEAR